MSVVTIWLLCGVIGLALELILPGLIVLFFGCGALLTGIATWIFPSLQIEGQLIVFVVSSVVLLLVFRKMLRNRFFNNSKESDDELADEYIGKAAVALTDFANGHGEVEFKGSKWEALSADEIRKGDTVVISSRESIKLTVEKK
ncbi:MAG: NfeD family protein [Bacteroidales bacterium]|nr:NfeD family protein [Bacteroidales bacterium]MBR6265796.1 NfeD family protein [Bacteroidales bacterium]